MHLTTYSSGQHTDSTKINLRLTWITVQNLVIACKPCQQKHEYGGNPKEDADCAQRPSVQLVCEPGIFLLWGNGVIHQVSMLKWNHLFSCLLCTDSVMGVGLCLTGRQQHSVSILALTPRGNLDSAASKHTYFWTVGGNQSSWRN